MWTVLAMIAAAAAGQGAPDGSDLQGMFEAMDRNGDGFVTANEAPRITQARSASGQVGAVRVTSNWIERYDRDGDSRVSRHEFVSGSLAELAAYKG